MEPQIYPLQRFVAGDHWPGIPSVQIKINGAAPPTALSSARLRFLNSGGPAVEIASPTGIVITNPTTWLMTIPKQAVPGLTAGHWRWQLKTTDAAGVVATWLAGEVEALESV